MSEKTWSVGFSSLVFHFLVFFLFRGPNAVVFFLDNWAVVFGIWEWDLRRRAQMLLNYTLEVFRISSGDIFF